MKKLLCKLFGHNWKLKGLKFSKISKTSIEDVAYTPKYRYEICQRCFIERRIKN